MIIPRVFLGNSWPKMITSHDGCFLLIHWPQTFTLLQEHHDVHGSCIVIEIGGAYAIWWVPNPLVLTPGQLKGPLGRLRRVVPKGFPHPVGNPYRILSFPLHVWHPRHIQVVTRTEALSAIKGFAPGGVRHSCIYYFNRGKGILLRKYRDGSGRCVKSVQTRCIVKVRERPPVLIQHVLIVLVFASWVLLLPRLPPSFRSIRLFPWASILLHGPLDIWLDLLPAAPLPPVQNQDAQHMFLQHRGAHAEKGEAQKSPLFWRFSGGPWFSQDRLFSRNSTRKPLHLIKSAIFTNTRGKSTCLYNAPSMHTVGCIAVLFNNVWLRVDVVSSQSDSWIAAIASDHHQQNCEYPVFSKSLPCRHQWLRLKLLGVKI